MTKPQFDKAFAIATSKENLDDVDDTILYGCGTPNFKQVTTTTRTFAKLLRWQVCCVNGSIDEKELNEMREISRKRILICD